HLNAINHTWANYFYAAGGTQLTDDFSQANGDSPAGEQALTYLKSFADDGLPTPVPHAVSGVVDGTVPLFAFQHVHLPEIAASGLSDEWSLAPMPEGPASNSSYVAGEFLVANAASDHLEAAGTFMKWMTSPQQAVRYMERAPIFPYELDKVDDATRAQVEALVDADPARAALLEQLTLASPEHIRLDRY